jgi:AcrR family transcriptional regulator
MSANVNRPRRRYDASGRRARAFRTRHEIVEAARRLFEQHGYSGTTVADVAREAQVSAETIYRAFGSKAALLGAVVRASLRGDSGPTPLRQRPRIEAIRHEHNPRRQLELYGKLLAEMNPRLAPLLRILRETTTGDPEAVAALSRLNADRLDGMSEFASLLAERQALRPGVSRQQARDAMWALNSPELYELLVLERGWSARRYGRWVAEQLAAALLAPGAS